MRGGASDLGITSASVAIEVPAVMRPYGRSGSSGGGQGDANVPYGLHQAARVHALAASGLLQGDVP